MFNNLLGGFIKRTTIYDQFMRNKLVKTLYPIYYCTRKLLTYNLMYVIFIAIGMCTNLWTANSNFQLHIFKVTARKELNLGLHTLQSTYITVIE